MRCNSNTSPKARFETFIKSTMIQLLYTNKTLLQNFKETILIVIKKQLHKSICNTHMPYPDMTEGKNTVK